MGPSKISRAEIAQWERDERIDLEPWERRAILRLDTLHLEIMTPKVKA
jgi:hypothetical protein